MKQTTTWVALASLAAISTVLSMTAGAFRPAITIGAAQPAANVEVTPAQGRMAAQPVDDIALKPAIEPESLPRQIIAPNALDVWRAADLPVDPSPAAPATITNIISRHWHEAKAGVKLRDADSQPAGKPKDGKAEPPGKRSKATTNDKACAPPTPNSLADLLRKLNLSPRCTPKRSATHQMPDVAPGFAPRTG